MSDFVAQSTIASASEEIASTTASGTVYASSSASSASSSALDRNCVLMTNDGQNFEIPIKLALYSNTLKTTIAEDYETDHEIPLPNVKSEVLAKVIEFLRYHDSEPMYEIEKPIKSNVLSDFVQDWYSNFVTEPKQEMVMELILAANYLDIRPLLDLTCAYVACLIKGRTPEEIRKNFNITVDFTPEEEAQLREENKWALDEL